MHTVQEAREIISAKINRQVPSGTIYTWIRNGSLKSKKLGGTVLIPDASLENFLSGLSETDCRSRKRSDSQ